jgi:hypothetical protein
MADRQPGRPEVDDRPSCCGAGISAVLTGALAAFVANFVRWVAHWLTTQCPQEPEGWHEEPLPGMC